MSDKTLTDAEVEVKLWKELADHRTGMLGLNGHGHLQPMTAFVEADTRQVWFYTYKDTDLAEATAGGADAVLTLQTKNIDACIDGRLTLSHDPERINKYWNSHVAAWYPDGKDDPRLTMLRLDVSEAAVWVSEAGPVKYAIEVAKANATKSTPDIGERRDLNLH